MADLDTITLSELEEVSELLDTDTLLVERNGRIKRFTGEIGGGNSGLVVTASNNTLNKTFAEIQAALAAGNIVILNQVDPRYGGPINVCTGCYTENSSSYAVYFLDSSYGNLANVTYRCTAASDYPQYYSG